jgi:hypothetical protein
MTNTHTRTLATEVLDTLGPTTRHSKPRVTGEATYILGHSQAEIQRLINQAAIIRSTTEHLLRSAGIERGMRVLDLGCGAGDSRCWPASWSGRRARSSA